MTADTETQAEVDETGLPGPGAPTPLSALEVSETLKSSQCMAMPEQNN